MLAALRLPFTLVLGLLLVLVADAAMFVLVSEIVPEALTVDSWWAALGAAFVASVASVILDPLFRTNDDEAYMLRVTQRIARRSGEQVVTDVPGIVFLEIDGLALPCCGGRCATATRRRWRAGSPRGLRADRVGDRPLLADRREPGRDPPRLERGHPAFRWIEKESGRTMTCSKPEDCAEIEAPLDRRRAPARRRRQPRQPALGRGRPRDPDRQPALDEEKRSNPGYRAFFANGFNVTRVLVLFFYEVLLEWAAAIRSARRDVRPRGHRGGAYPFMRAAMCVIVRDLIVFGVISDMMRGGPAIYATFSSYDEVAHHSGPGAPDTLEALRKLDQQFGRIERARAYAARPYEIVVLSDHGQTQGATFLQRNGYSLAELVTVRSRAATAAAVGRATRTTPWSGTR